MWRSARRGRVRAGETGPWKVGSLAAGTKAPHRLASLWDSPRGAWFPTLQAHVSRSLKKTTMDLAITGTVTQLLPEQSGESRNGPWRKQEFIIETEGNFPKPVCVVMWGDNIDKFALTEGERVTAHIDIQSREYNGRWYTDVKAWKLERDGAGGAGAPPVDPNEPFPEPPSDVDMDEDDDLPF